jgi:hypothetical protein
VLIIMPLLCFCYAGLIIMPQFCSAGLIAPFCCCVGLPPFFPAGPIIMYADFLLLGVAHYYAAILLCGVHATSSLCGDHAARLMPTHGSAAAASLIISMSPCCSAAGRMPPFIVLLCCGAHAASLPRLASSILICGVHGTILLFWGAHADMLRCGDHAAIFVMRCACRNFRMLAWLMPLFCSAHCLRKSNNNEARPSTHSFGRLLFDEQVVWWCDCAGAS